MSQKPKRLTFQVEGHVDAMPVVIVEWEDACLDLDFDGVAAPDVGKTIILQDTGFLFRKNKRVVVLVGCRCLANKTVRWVNTIPTRLVKSITILTPQPAPPESVPKLGDK